MGFYRGPRTPIKDLTLLLDVKNIKSYPGSGNIIYDLSKLDYSATISGGVTISNDVFNFDGNSGSLRLLNHEDLYPHNTDFTYSTWLNFNSFTGTYRHILYDNAGGGHTGFGLLLQPNTNNMIVEIYGTLNSRQIKWVSTANYINGWNHWTFVIQQSNNTIKVYINGNYSEILTYNPWGDIDAQYNIHIGSHSNSGYFYDGQMSLIQMYKRILIPSEILNIYNGHKSRFT